MATLLKFSHREGLRLRQQVAAKVERTEDGTVKKGTEWRFNPEECKQDEDPRKRNSDGSPLKLGTYSVYITSGINNLVIEAKGKPESLDFKNPSIRNQLRVQYQVLTEVKPAKDEKQARKEWRNSGPAQYIAPNAFTGVLVGDGQRVIVDEMPT